MARRAKLRNEISHMAIKRQIIEILTSRRFLLTTQQQNFLSIYNLT